MPRSRFPSLAAPHAALIYVIPAVVVLAVLLAIGSFVVVGPGSRGVLMTFGSVSQGVLAPGLHFKVPVAQTVKIMDVRVQKSEAKQWAASKDLQDVTTQVAVNWSIDPADAQWVYQNIGDESALVTRVIDPIISNAVKAVTAHFNAQDLVVERDTVRQQIEQEVEADAGKYKVKIEGLNITNFAFSPEYSHAIEAKQVAQQKAEQAEYELQQAKVEAQKAIAEAQGQSDAQKLLQLTLTPEIIQYDAIHKWNGVLPQVTGGQGVFPMVGNLGSTAK